MAQLTQGISLEWVAASGSEEPKMGWAKIPDVTSIPTLIGAPSNHDVTTLYDKQKVYIEGLPDNGGALEFATVLTPEVFTVTDAIIAAQATDKPWFRISLPKPLNKAYVFRGTMATPSNDEFQPDNPIMGKLIITPSTSIELKPIEA